MQNRSVASQWILRTVWIASVIAWLVMWRLPTEAGFNPMVRLYGLLLLPTVFLPAGLAIAVTSSNRWLCLAVWIVLAGMTGGVAVFHFGFMFFTGVGPIIFPVLAIAASSLVGLALPGSRLRRTASYVVLWLLLGSGIGVSCLAFASMFYGITH